MGTKVFYVRKVTAFILGSIMVYVKFGFEVGIAYACLLIILEEKP